MVFELIEYGVVGVEADKISIHTYNPVLDQFKNGPSSRFDLDYPMALPGAANDVSEEPIDGIVGWWKLDGDLKNSAATTAAGSGSGGCFFVKGWHFVRQGGVDAPCAAAGLVPKSRSAAVAQFRSCFSVPIASPTFHPRQEVDL